MLFEEAGKVDIHEPRRQCSSQREDGADSGNVHRPAAALDRAKNPLGHKPGRYDPTDVAHGGRRRPGEYMVAEFRIHDAGKDLDQVHGGASQLAAQGIVNGVQGGFGGAIDRAPRKGDSRRYRTDVYNDTAGLLAHERNDELCEG